MSHHNREGPPPSDATVAPQALHVGRRMRAYDVAARIGGDELVLLLPETTLEEAEGITHHLCARFRATPVAGAPEGLTVSVGVACLRDETPLECLARADTALYVSKRVGRDRVTVQSA
ncbi:MAG: GGDEF domain-containing protein [Trueperaceae bacterium]|nr:GGDEF domain-containing protein [Trueperaceae bacterium]